MRIFLAAAAIAAGSFFAPSAHADNLLGNLPETNDNGVLSIGTFMASQFQAAVKFTIPAGTPYILDNLQLRLSMASTGGPVVVTIHEDDAVGDEPGTLVATLTNPVFGDDPPMPGDANTFTPAGIVKLEANTTYWFLVDHGDNTAEVLWHRSSPAILPSGIATFDQLMSSNDDGATYTVTTQYASFQINASEVVYQPDLSIGESDKPGQAKKNDQYNTTGAGQVRVAKLLGRKKEKAYLFVQNDSNDIDTITLKSNKPRKKLYRLNIFQLTGGKTNISAAVKSAAGLAFPDLAPGERILCRIELKGKNKRGNQTVKYTGASLKDAAKSDVNLLKVKARP